MQPVGVFNKKHKSAQAQAFTTRTETEHFSEFDKYYFASRVCCLLSSLMIVEKNQSITLHQLQKQKTDQQQAW